MCFDGGRQSSPNHTITVINLLSAIVPVPLRNLLLERQRACLENRKKTQGKKRQRVVNCVFDGQNDSLLRLLSVCVGVFSTQ